MSLKYQNPTENHLEKIKSLDSLEPSKETNSVFSALVSDIIQNKLNSNLEQDRKKLLQEKSCEAEFKLEKHWAEKIIDSEIPEQKIKDFPYYQNYIKLADFEYSTLSSCCREPEKQALFVGGGPIPFTAIIFAKKYDFNITVMDRNEEAVKMSRKLLRELDIDGKVVQSDASEFDNYGDFGTIHVASMVGSTKNEELEVFKNIKSQVTDHSHVIARTVHGNRRLLYRPVSDEVKAMFDILAESRPSADIINSTIIMARD